MPLQGHCRRVEEIQREVSNVDAKTYDRRTGAVVAEKLFKAKKPKCSKTALSSRDEFWGSVPKDSPSRGPKNSWRTDDSREESPVLLPSPVTNSYVGNETRALAVGSPVAPRLFVRG